MTGLRLCQHRSAILPWSRHSSGFRACCALTASKNIWRRAASRSGVRIFLPTTGTISRRRASLISRSKGWRPMARAFCCCTIQARTVAALPKILHEMKARGYHIVHVVPATPQQPATPTEPPQWQLHPPSENVPIAHWPKIPNFVFAEVDAFPAPVLPNFDAPDGALFLSGEPFNRARRIAQNPPLPREAPWPRLSELPVENAAITLPVPEEKLFEVPADARAAFESAPPRRTEVAAEPEAEGQSKRAAAETRRSERATAAA